MAWVYLVLAGCMEMLGVGFISRFNKHRDFTSAILLFGGFGLSFLFLSLAMRELPMGLSYAIWTGIGAAGGAIIGIIVYKEPRNTLRIVCIFLIIASVVALKLIS